jgi:large subunit ribosomal protein L13
MKKTEKTKIKEIKKEKILDASGKSLGRVSSLAAGILLGKDSASFQRNVYSGSPLKIMNASKLRINAEKLGNIVHKRYSGYRGGLRQISGTEVVEKKGFKELLEHSIYKMLPGNKLRREMMKNLTIEE